MAVNLSVKEESQLYAIDGISLFVGQAGIKKPDHHDLTVILLADGTTVAGVFTQNRFCAAPVVLCKEILAGSVAPRALVINTGNANAGTGQTGRDNARSVCQSVAKQFGLITEQVLPFSTGVILEPLPVNKITNALSSLKQTTWGTVAQAIMTTDTLPKAASRKMNLSDGTSVSFTGVSKGSGMIHPNMATMLGFIGTDAAISQNVLNQLVKEVADTSFNCITVDGDTSTNDSFVIMATGAAKNTPIDQIGSADYELLKETLSSLALELAQAIVRDGEGATKFMTINAQNAATKEEAQKVAYAIAHSPLVKTAFFASDPNLGRLLCAIGYAGVNDLDVNQIQLFLDDVLVAEKGGRALSYQEEDGARVMAQDEITVTVKLNRGQVNTTVYTCDFSYDYVRINADYRS
ncbi:bifunctional glutamate N-acetyltransferase/amino-acid acetyltransferase ArgJ [Neisseria sp. Ec49-e6-T10]|uniref:bifunctional glutamate N-acetyltransferase/amino-acid acetyltransferase ArgJ n=1 Tax=Neisseria sp. Ec49-e6-T10 TaxID=3140744 RepID=UPI003EB7CB04